MDPPSPKNPAACIYPGMTAHPPRTWPLHPPGLFRRKARNMSNGLRTPWRHPLKTRVTIEFRMVRGHPGVLLPETQLKGNSGLGHTFLCFPPFSGPYISMLPPLIPLSIHISCICYFDAVWKERAAKQPFGQFCGPSYDPNRIDLSKNAPS